MSAKTASALAAAGYYPDGGGLYLQVSKSPHATDDSPVKEPPAKSWVFRFALKKRRREMGLGSLRFVSLADARTQAMQCRRLVQEGKDPITERQAAQATAVAARQALMSFDACAEAYIASHRGGWRNAKHAQQWEATLRQYASPVVGALPVAAVELSHVVLILEPIWRSKTETASRLRGRIESVLSWATVRGFRQGDNPARWRGHLDQLLPIPSKVNGREHHAALPYKTVPTFVARLRSQVGMGAQALEFVILCAARSGEVREASWAEVDIDTRVWTVPANRMKAGREHRVPLSDAAWALLPSSSSRNPSELLFPSQKGAALSDMTLTAVMRRMQVDAVPHGFRSSFRDWCAEQTDYPREVAEMALAHAIGDKVEAAYRRGDLFEKRKVLMQEWADFCAGK